MTEDKTIDKGTNVKMPLWKLLTYALSALVTITLVAWQTSSVYSGIANKAEKNSISITEVKEKNTEQDIRLNKIERNIDRKLTSILGILEKR